MSPRVWLITGTSSGLGTELVKAVLARGDNVIATARNADRIAHLKDIGAATMQLDVTVSQSELDRKAEEAIEVYGRVDVLVNNAGYTQFGTVEETTHDDWYAQFNTNVFGTLNTTRSFLPHMRAEKAGTVVFIGSMVAWDGAPTVGPYCASKAAIHYAAESLSREVAPLGIKTLLVEPGTFRTELLSQQNKKSGVTKFDDYKALNESFESIFRNLNGNQAGDARKGVERIVDVVKGENDAAEKEWPMELVIGSDAVAGIRKKCEDTLRLLAEWEEVSKSTDL
ncbi:hypothetical protein N7474_010755 [Penicillium riverlandense]|uniref:uncharacterized protein n=1 Tax=Penicillium riverlandense TaxID=1903569 RepID=UPI0025487393|nr:uncharacterized protein N7474_010755 [Penicillium riverlandense]KAJ5804868.1 hypothetical protein N7474_010755 [Penicillium riverlandense]